MSTLSFTSLEQNLFQIDKFRKKGFKAILNLNFLPELLSYLKSFLNKQELACLNDYEVQNLLIETCFSQLRINRLTLLRDYLLIEMRKNGRFWLVGSEVFISLNNGKIIRDDSNMGGVEFYRQYLQKIDEIKKDCGMEDSVSSVVKLEENEKREENGYSIKNNELTVKTNKIEEEKEVKKEGEEELRKMDSEIFEKLLDLSDTQRLTRHQKKQLFGENMNATEFKKFINQTSSSLKRKKEMEIHKSIFNINKYKKYPKIEFQIFPFIFGFLKEIEGGIFTKRLEFQLQNLLLFFLLQEKPNKKKFRINQNLFKETEKQTLMTLEEEGLIMTGEKTEEPKVEISNDLPEILNNFIEYCDKKGFLVLNLLVTEASLRRSQLNLLYNVLTLALIYLKSKRTFVSLNSPLSPDSENSTLSSSAPPSSLLFEALESLDSWGLYESPSAESYKQLVDYYIKEIEQVKLNNLSEHYLQFEELNAGHQKRGIVGYFDSLGKLEEIFEFYQQIINSPAMQKKREYRFHTESRGGWTPEMYQKFLEGLERYLDVPINNKKIAKFVGANARSNHVRFIKGKYMRKLKRRAKELKISAKELLKKDREEFRLELFEEPK